jgi:hypothetical protein
LSRLCHAAKHDAVERVAEHVAPLEHRDALGAAPGETPTAQVRGVSERAGRLRDPLARSHVHPSAAVQGLGDRGRRHTGEPRDVSNGHHGGLPNRFDTFPIG